MTFTIKTQKSSMRRGEEKKQFVLQNMEDGDTQVSALIDFLVVKGPAVLVTSASDFAGLGNFPHLFSGPIRGYKGAYKGPSGLMRGYKVSFFGGL